MPWRSLLFLLLLCGPAPLLAEEAEIDSGRAVRLAEAYVVLQGYTERPTPLPPEALDGGSLERFSRETWLEARRGTLSPKAIGYRRGARIDEQGWSVIFYCRRNQPLPKLFGQTIEMDRFGKRMRALHSHEEFSRYRPAHPKHGR